MDRLGNMTAFVRVVAAGSFSAAARRLHTTPAAVSRQIQVLEAWLGVRLFERTTRRLHLTEAGAAFHERCLRILGELEEAREEAASVRSQPRGVLRVSAPTSYGIRHLAPLLAEYLKAHPEVAVELSLSDRRVDLVDEGFDLALRIGRLADSSLQARRLAENPMLLCASPHYLAAAGVPRRPADLRQHSCLEFSLSQDAGHWTFYGPDGEERVPIRGRLTANNGLVLHEAALQGQGIAYAPAFIVSASLDEGALVRLLPEYRLQASAVYAVYPPGRHLPAKTRSFIDFLVSRGLPS